MTARTCVSDLRVRYAETDQMGVAHHGSYVVWCEVGRTDFLRMFGTSYAELEKTGIRLPVAELSIRYHASARYDDQIRVETMLSEVKSRTLTFDYVITDVTAGIRLVTAQTTLVSLDERGQVTALPAELRAQLLEAVC
jgi:acyl-CoA thioester hydrolase